MKKWKYEVNIKQYLTEDETFEGIAKASNAIAKELRKLPIVFFDDHEFKGDVEFLESVHEEDSEVYGDSYELLEEVNFRLNSVYNFADINRIWLGL